MNLAALLLMMRAAAGYNEPFRPQIHFSPQKNWTNDPNGLVWFEGEYHLFFQYNPFGDVWGHMSWGHAVSRDLLHWQELPVALSEEDGIMIFTGSVVADARNTSGFCTGGKPCMVAVYTGHSTGHSPGLQTQNLAFSNDRGRTWTKYSGNPVLNLNRAEFRDPHVFWHAGSGRWIMAVSLPDDHKVRIYGSADLRKWEYLSEFGPAGTTAGQWECPALLELPVDGDTHQTKWVLKIGLNPGGLQGGSGEQYFVGGFDGTTFVNDNPSALSLWTDYGKDCYCALPFNDLPSTRAPVMLGWMNNWQYANRQPTSPWRGQMTIPRELALRTFPEGIRLVQKPVEALASLRGKAGNRPKGSSFEIQTALEIEGAAEAGWKLKGKDGSYTLIGYDSRKEGVFLDRTHSGLVTFNEHFPTRTAAPLPRPNGVLAFHIIVDRNSIEVFADDGRIAITNLVFPTAQPTAFQFYSEGNARALPATIWPLKTVWSGNNAH
jgi:fructan beta-fructosidase